MSDYIKREDAINVINGITMYRGTIPHDSALFNIDKIRSADVVEVVRCKDCKHRHDSLLNESPFEDFCDVFPAYIGKDDYCSYGERTEE